MRQVMGGALQAAPARTHTKRTKTQASDTGSAGCDAATLQRAIEVTERQYAALLRDAENLLLDLFYCESVIRAFASGRDPELKARLASAVWAIRRSRASKPAPKGDQ